MDFAGGQSVHMPSENDMMHQVKAELATAYAQEFYNVSEVGDLTRSSSWFRALDLTLFASVACFSARP